jgi:hypothetical protein
MTITAWAPTIILERDAAAWRPHLLKGEAEGHPFRGNQWEAGESGSDLAFHGSPHEYGDSISARDKAPTYLTSDPRRAREYAREGGTIYAVPRSSLTQDERGKLDASGQVAIDHDVPVAGRLPSGAPIYSKDQFAAAMVTTERASSNDDDAWQQTYNNAAERLFGKTEGDTLTDEEDEAAIAAANEEVSQKLWRPLVIKGEEEGHPFNGNQWTGGIDHGEASQESAQTAAALTPTTEPVTAGSLRVGDTLMHPNRGAVTVTAVDPVPGHDDKVRITGTNPDGTKQSFWLTSAREYTTVRGGAAVTEVPKEEEPVKTRAQIAQEYQVRVRAADAEYEKAYVPLNVAHNDALDRASLEREKVVEAAQQRLISVTKDAEDRYNAAASASWAKFYLIAHAEPRYPGEVYDAARGARRAEIANAASIRDAARTYAENERVKRVGLANATQQHASRMADNTFNDAMKPITAARDAAVTRAGEQRDADIARIPAVEQPRVSGDAAEYARIKVAADKQYAADVRAAKDTYENTRSAAQLELNKAQADAELVRRDAVAAAVAAYMEAFNAANPNAGYSARYNAELNAKTQPDVLQVRRDAAAARDAAYERAESKAVAIFTQAEQARDAAVAEAERAHAATMATAPPLVAALVMGSEFHVGDIIQHPKFGNVTIGDIAEKNGGANYRVLGTDEQGKAQSFWIASNKQYGIVPGYAVGGVRLGTLRPFPPPGGGTEGADRARAMIAMSSEQAALMAVGLEGAVGSVAQEAKMNTAQVIDERMTDVDSLRLIRVGLSTGYGSSIPEKFFDSSELFRISATKVNSDGSIKDNAYNGWSRMTDQDTLDLGPRVTQDYVFVRGGDPRMIQNLREVAISNLIHTWASTSNDNHPDALAMQEVAAKEFGIAGAKAWGMDQYTRANVASRIETNGDIYAAFLHAQYDATQDLFAKAGITEVVLYRGFKFSTPPAWARLPGKDAYGNTVVNGPGRETIATLRPLSSCSYSPRQATGFSGSANPRVISMTVPVSRILSTPRSGFGCYGEKEYVIIGGKTVPCWVDTPASYRIQEKQ